MDLGHQRANACDLVRCLDIGHDEAVDAAAEITAQHAGLLRPGPQQRQRAARMRRAHQIGNALDIGARILAIEKDVIEAWSERRHEIGG